MNELKAFAKSLLSRKFLLCIIAAGTAYSVAIQDNSISQADMWTILTPILAFIGVEGGADIATRFTNIPTIEPAGKARNKARKKALRKAIRKSQNEYAPPNPKCSKCGAQATLRSTFQAFLFLFLKTKYWGGGSNDVGTN